jgi:hypothetical protein
MNWKKIFLQGIISGLLAAFGCIAYSLVYQHSFLVDFSKLVNPIGIIGSSVFGCMIMAIAYGLLDKMNKQNLIGVLNVIFVLVSFASIIGPISMSLPLDIESPEMFPGLVIPMHFLPTLAFLTLLPFFKK